MKNFNLYILVAIALIALTSIVSAKDNAGDALQSTDRSVESEQQSFAEYQDIVDALQPYIISAKTGDGQLTRTAFFDHAHIVGSVAGQFYNADLDTFVKSINDGGTSPLVKHHIAWIDISGPAAAAKVEFINWQGFRFTDFFVLYKHDGQWKISGKVYDSHSNN